MPDKKKIINNTNGKKDLNNLEIQDESVNLNPQEERPGIGYEIFGSVGTK